METVNVYNISDPQIAYPMDRDEFYREQIEVFQKEGRPSKAVELIIVLLFNSHGEILIQKRSNQKSHNAGLLDKSIGGHIKRGDSPEYTAMVETIQELQTPSIILSDQEDFNKTMLLLRDYLETIAVVQFIDKNLYAIPKVINGEKVDIGNMVHFYLGVYNGKIRPVDREAKGVLWYSLQELKDEIKKAPEMFSLDLHFYLTQYKEEIEYFVANILKKES